MVCGTHRTVMHIVSSSSVQVVMVMASAGARLEPGWSFCGTSAGARSYTRSPGGPRPGSPGGPLGGPRSLQEARRGTPNPSCMQAAPGIFYQKTPTRTGETASLMDCPVPRRP